MYGGYAYGGASWGSTLAFGGAPPPADADLWTVITFRPTRVRNGSTAVINLVETRTRASADATAVATVNS